MIRHIQMIAGIFKFFSFRDFYYTIFYSVDTFDWIGHIIVISIKILFLKLFQAIKELIF